MVGCSKLLRAGIEVEVLKNKYAFKIGGFNHKSLRIPRRVIEVETPVGPLDEGFTREGLETFFKLLG